MSIDLPTRHDEAPSADFYRSQGLVSHLVHKAIASALPQQPSDLPPSGQPPGSEDLFLDGESTAEAAVRYRNLTAIGALAGQRAKPYDTVGTIPPQERVLLERWFLGIELHISARCLSCGTRNMITRHVRSCHRWSTQWRHPSSCWGTNSHP